MAKRQYGHATQSYSLWISILRLMSCQVSAFIPHSSSLAPRASSSTCPRPLHLLPLAAADVGHLVEGVSWTTAALYGGLPLAAVSFLATRPPSRLVSEQELAEITAGTNLQGRADVTCLYKASRDGWSATDFHDRVDTLGSGVVVARSLTGQVFGGYNPAGWRSTDDYVTSTAAFLWARRGGIVKFPILPGGNAAVFDFATAGPTFGASDLQIGPSRAAV